MQCIEISKVKRNNQHWRNSIIPLPYVNSLNPQEEIEKLLCVVGLLSLLFESVIPYSYYYIRVEEGVMCLYIV